MEGWLNSPVSELVGQVSGNIGLLHFISNLEQMFQLSWDLKIHGSLDGSL